jgi:hypothetical protein
MAGPSSFIAHGTGFIGVNFIGEAGFQTLITARHVIDRMPGGIVHVRLNTRDGEARIIETTKADWIRHPDKRIDVVVCATGIPKEIFDYLHIPLYGPDLLTPDVIRDRDIGIGDEVFVAGMFIARLGETKNIPILRSGTIAAMPEEKIKTEYGYHDAYLIEARSIDGLSGSPVFVQMPPIRVKDGQPKFQHGPVQYLMGMLLGHNSVGNPGDTIEILQPGADRPSSDKVHVSIPLNTGIGVVLPIAYAIEAVEQPLIHEKRVATMKKPNQDRGFMADSAKKSAPSTTPDNPSHKEDFTRLLDAATAKRQSDDQT